jgi:hypothetical protein
MLLHTVRERKGLAVGRSLMPGEAAIPSLTRRSALTSASSCLVTSCCLNSSNFRCSSIFATPEEPISSKLASHPRRNLADEMTMLHGEEETEILSLLQVVIKQWRSERAPGTPRRNCEVSFASGWVHETLGARLKCGRRGRPGPGPPGGVGMRGRTAIRLRSGIADIISLFNSRNTKITHPKIFNFLPPRLEFVKLVLLNSP